MHWLLGPSMGASFKKLVEEKMMQTKQVRPQLEAFLASTHWVRFWFISSTQKLTKKKVSRGCFWVAFWGSLLTKNHSKKVGFCLQNRIGRVFGKSQLLNGWTLAHSKTKSAKIRIPLASHLANIVKKWDFLSDFQTLYILRIFHFCFV